MNLLQISILKIMNAKTYQIIDAVGIWEVAVELVESGILEQPETWDLPDGSCGASVRFRLTNKGAKVRSDILGED